MSRPTIDWAPLDAELARWRDAGRHIPIWWRDDDAVAATGPLDRLIALSATSGLPLHLAVIPAGAGPDLAQRLAMAPTVVPVVHGWAHRAHTPPTEKKAEFSAARPLADRLDDAQRALGRLQHLLRGNPVVPMFVPPWNRMAPDLAPALSTAGYRFVSTFGPRPAQMAASGLVAVNAHVDVVDWRGTRSLVPPERLIAGLVATLTARREHREDAAEPLGLLTHHLVHDAAIWDVTERLIDRLAQGPVQFWSARTPNEEGHPA